MSGRLCRLLRMQCLLSQWWLLSQEIWASGARGGFCRCCGLLAANDRVVGALVKDSVAAFGAENEVIRGRRVQINLSKARCWVNSEVADVVVCHSVEGGAPQADSIVSARPHNDVIPHRSEEH